MSPLFYAAPTPAIYTLSLHDALPISLDVLVHHARIGETALDDAPHVVAGRAVAVDEGPVQRAAVADLLQAAAGAAAGADRKSTRLNSSHGYISYAVFCLKKKKYETIH